MGAAGASIRTWPLLEINIKRESGRSDSKRRLRLDVEGMAAGHFLLSVVLRAHSLNCAVGSD